MLFVPDDVAKATTERLLAEVREKQKKRSAEWRKRFHEENKNFKHSGK